MRRFPYFVFCFLVAIFLCACAKTSPQIVVPVVGKQMEDYRVSRERRIEQLKAEFPDLPQTTLEAFSSIPRPRFVADLARHRSYEDQMLPIGSEQATLRLSDIAWLITTMHIRPTDTVLEIGTGTGYMTAILARTAKAVYTVEINEYLSENAQMILDSLKISNVSFRTHDGLDGWKARAPFDVIIYTAAIPPLERADGEPVEKYFSETILSQLASGGRIAVPFIESPTRTPWRVYALKPVEPGDASSDSPQGRVDDKTTPSAWHLVEVATRKANITPAIVP